jgi:hypothetical protein
VFACWKYAPLHPDITFNSGLAVRYDFRMPFFGCEQYLGYYYSSIFDVFSLTDTFESGQRHCITNLTIGAFKVILNDRYANTSRLSRRV